MFSGEWQTMYCYDVSSPAQRVIILNQPRLITWLVNPFQTLVKERQARVLVGNKRPFLNEPTERLHLHQVHVELVVWFVTAFQKPYVHHTYKINNTATLHWLTTGSNQICEERHLWVREIFFEVESTAWGYWVCTVRLISDYREFFVIDSFCRVQTSRGQFEEVSHSVGTTESFELTGHSKLYCNIGLHNGITRIWWICQRLTTFWTEVVLSYHFYYSVA